MLIIFFSALAQKSTSKSQKIVTPISIDGNIDDWGGSLNFYNEECKMTYSIGNDQSNLYLIFRIYDQRMQRKIMRTGLEVAIDTTGKKKSSVSIFYPVAQQEVMGMKGNAQNRDLSEMKKSFQEHYQMMELTGFKEGNGVNSSNAGNGVSVKMDWDKNRDLIYEMQIPFDTFWKSNLTKGDFEKDLSLNIYIPAMSRPNSSGQGQGSGQGNGGGRGSGMGGGGRGSQGGGGYGPSSGNYSDMQMMMVSQKFRHKLRLTR